MYRFRPVNAWIVVTRVDFSVARKSMNFWQVGRLIVIDELARSGTWLVIYRVETIYGLGNISSFRQTSFFLTRLVLNLSLLFLLVTAKKKKMNSHNWKSLYLIDLENSINQAWKNAGELIASKRETHEWLRVHFWEIQVASKNVRRSGRNLKITARLYRCSGRQRSSLVTKCIDDPR